MRRCGDDGHALPSHRNGTGENDKQTIKKKVNEYVCRLNGWPETGTRGTRGRARGEGRYDGDGNNIIYDNRETMIVPG